MSRRPKTISVKHSPHKRSCLVRWKAPVLVMTAAIIVGIVLTIVHKAKDVHHCLNPTIDYEEFYDVILKDFLVPRPVGSQGHENVRKHIRQLMTDWDITEDNFHETVRGRSWKFHNIIAQSDPSKEKTIIISCHYDSKMIPEVSVDSKFIGATDSAVPCALIISLANTLKKVISLTASKYNLMVVFFDGEEAFYEWTATDSLYGSRHLARNWKKLFGSPSKIHKLILLDLIGADNCVFHNTFPSTSQDFKNLSLIERQLRTNGHISALSNSFADKSPKTINVEDDHIPFLRKGIQNILHLICIPFPKEWHTMGDNEEVINSKAVTDFHKILQQYLCEMMG